ncbi:hypothetical protein INT47_007114 [Mucor saturninus]|uniref:Integrase catalytic domain-containing protein n=1 Tax=Mucor saturninus TaxID=64648 RepID=A0A8H7QF77_9FUNG|nr:hypothetical protein INT47_007114 [Mucor saturninus]
MDYPLYLSIFYFLTRNGEYPNGSTQAIKRKVRRQAKKYVAFNGKLFRQDSKVPYGQELLHEGIAEEVVTRVHCEGHSGVNNTWRQVRLQYTGPRLYELVRKVVQSCITCQVRARKIRKRWEPARPINTPVKPFYMVGCDAVGPIKTSKNGFRYLLVAVDYLTRWPIAIPVKDITSETTADFMYDQLVVNYGVPSYILTDRGSNFTSGFVREFLSLVGCRHITTTAYRPQTNGLCERLNQTLVQTLAKITRDADAQDRWDEFVNSALLVLRTMSNDSTGFSPAMLLFGYDMRTPAIWPAPRTDFVEGEAMDEVASRIKVVQLLTDGLREEARQKTKDRQQQDKRRYDGQVGPRKRFSVGEQVLMRDNKPATKLQDRWLGPMVVNQVNKNGTYHLTGPNYLRLQGAVNGDSLVPFYRHRTMIPDVQVRRAQAQFQAWLDRVTPERMVST